MMDYTKLSEVIVHTQKELDAIPLNYKGRIYIDSDVNICIKIRHNYYYPVVVKGNSSVVVCVFPHVVNDFPDFPTIEAYGNSSIKVNGYSLVKAFENSTVEAFGYSIVMAYDNSTVEAFGYSSVRAYKNSTVRASGNVQVVDFGAKIQISENARIVTGL